MSSKHNLPPLEYADIHTHILPGIDDGSENLDMSLSMLKMLQNQGVRNVALTPHFRTQEENMKDFLEKRKEFSPLRQTPNRQASEI